MASGVPQPAASSAPRDLDQSALPPTVAVRPGEPVEAYWRRRLAQHTGDWYAGLRLQKLPEDLRVYEHLLWASAPDAVIEIGSHRGGSTLWFRDRLAALDRYRPGRRPRRVVAVSQDVGPATEGVSLRDPAWGDSITFVEGDVLDPALPERVADALPADASCLVVEDTAHVYATTTAALLGFARFVRAGGFLVVEDGVVDVPALAPSAGGGGGVLPAVEDWLASPAGRDFTRRRDLELYGLTSSPHGWLQRRPR